MHQTRLLVVLVTLALPLSLGACKNKNKRQDKDAGATEQTTAPKGSGADQQTPTRPEPPKAPEDVAKAPADAKKTAGSSIPYKILKEGTGTAAGKNDLVSLHLEVWNTKGETLQSTRMRGQVVRYPLGGIPMRSLAEAVIGMKLSEQRRVWIPEELEYAPRPGEPKEARTYDLELVSVKPAPPFPEGAGKAPADAKKTKKGVAYKVVKAGTGKNKPEEHDQIKTKISEFTADGRLLKSTLLGSDQPVPVGVKDLTPGLIDAVTGMVAGEVRHVWVPAEHGYVDHPTLPAGDLFYEIEVVEVVDLPAPPKTPEDVAAPPKTAKKTEKGVFYRVLNKGTGTTKPTAQSRVTVHYSGWTTDGKMFDSSVTRGQPATFSLGGVIPGWTDGLQTMVQGEKTRFWIPAKMAYEGRQGPQGMLVFDVELISFE